MKDDTFIGSIAKTVLNRYPDTLEDLVIVFPNRRAGLFFARELVRQASRSLLLPAIFSGDEFISWFTSLDILDDLNSTMSMYRLREIKLRALMNSWAGRRY